jgi:hypothetical protein
VNDLSEGMWKESVVTSFELITLRLTGWTDENHEKKTHSEQPEYGLTF